MQHVKKMLQSTDRHQSAAGAHEMGWNGTCEGLLDLHTVPLEEFPFLLRADAKVFMRDMRCRWMLPLDNVECVVNAVVALGRMLHKQDVGCPLEQSVLIVAQSGLGKASALRKLAQPGVLHEMLRVACDAGEPGAAFDPQVSNTVVLRLGETLRWGLRDTSIAFLGWLLKALLAAATPVSCGGGELERMFLEGGHRHATLVEQWPTDTDYTAESTRIAIQAASDLLRKLQVRVLVICNHADVLFTGRIEQQAASRWLAQLHAISTLDNPAIALVLCAKIQWAPQLFVRQWTEPVCDIRARYTHIDPSGTLAGTWSRDEMQVVVMPPPAWTAFTLACFATACTCYGDTAAEQRRQARCLDHHFAALVHRRRTIPDIVAQPDTSCVGLGMRAFVGWSDVPGYLSTQHFLPGGRLDNAGLNASPHAPRTACASCSSPAQPLTRAGYLLCGVILDTLADQGLLAKSLHPVQLLAVPGDSDQGASAASKRLQSAPEKYLLGCAPETLRVPTGVVCEKLRRIDPAVHGVDASRSEWISAAISLATCDKLIVEGSYMHADGSPRTYLQLQSPALAWRLGWQRRAAVPARVVDCFLVPTTGAGSLRHMLPVARALVRFAAEREHVEHTAATACRFLRGLTGEADATPAEVRVPSPRGARESNLDACECDIALVRVLDSIEAPGDRALEKSASEVARCSWDTLLLKSASALIPLPDVTDLDIHSATTAYLDAFGKHSAVNCLLGCHRRPVWLALQHGSAASELISVFAHRRDGRVNIQVVRVCVCIAPQSDLRSAHPEAAADAAALQALRTMSGSSDPELAAQHAALRAQNARVGNAVRSAVYAANMGKSTPRPPSWPHLGKWTERFLRRRMNATMHVATWLATTHTPSTAARAQLLECGMDVLDARDLQHSWGEMKEVGCAHGILPFCECPAPQQQRGVQRSPHAAAAAAGGEA